FSRNRKFALATLRVVSGHVSICLQTGEARGAFWSPKRNLKSCCEASPLSPHTAGRFMGRGKMRSSLSHGGSEMPRGSGVLIVDDDQDLREILARLVRKEGFTPLTAADGGSALELLRLRGAEVMLADVHLPDRDGLELLKRPGRWTRT